MFDLDIPVPTPVSNMGSWGTPSCQCSSRRGSLRLLSQASQDFEPIQIAYDISTQLDDVPSSRRLSISQIGDWNDQDPTRRDSLDCLSTMEPLNREFRCNRRGSFDWTVYNMEFIKPAHSQPQPVVVSDSGSLSSCQSAMASSTTNTKVKQHELVNPARQHFQDGQWNDRYQELVAFHGKHGHLSIPQTSEANTMLAQWMKRQRYQYQLRKKGHHSTLTETRLQALQKIGFVWESHSSSWNKNFQALQDFKLNCGHVNVPNANKSLSAWCKHQRREWRKFVKGQRSRITLERIAELEALGFKWDPRGLC